MKNLSVALFFLGFGSWSAAQEIRHAAKPAPKPEEGKVLITTYSVDWALRDDPKPSSGSLETYYSKAAAEAYAVRRLRENRDAHTDGKAWTWIKYMEITAAPELVYEDDAVLGRVRAWKAVDAALAKKVDKCNFLVQEAATAAGIDGLAGLTADKMGEYFASADGKKAGWAKVVIASKTDIADPATVLEAANRLARQGHLVVGVITSADRNAARPKGKGTDAFSNGHVVVVTASGGSDWKDTVVASANAGKEKTGRLVPANEITYPWERPKYQFYAIPIPANPAK